MDVFAMNDFLLYCLSGEWVDATVPFFDTFFLALVGFCCVLHINRGIENVWCLRLGYAMIIAGALGGALEWWWPWDNQYHYYSELTLHSGMAFVAVGLTRDDLRHFILREWHATCGHARAAAALFRR
jgi:hypothetical protein